MRAAVRKLSGLALGALAGRLAYQAAARRPPGGPERWERKNHRGEPLTLLEGPALVAGMTVGSLLTPGLTPRVRAAATLAGLGAGALGAYDDLAGSGAVRGLKGHFGALARGEVTTGAVKILGIGATGLAAAALIDRSPVDIAIDGALIAGSANLLNLFDLRPGRAIKVAMIGGVPALLSPGDVAAAPLGAAAALLPEDLGERSMLGDAGANALGAVIGLAAATRLGRRGRLAALAGVVALTAASEVVSFTKVIQRTPPLRWLDELGRRPAPAAPSTAVQAAEEEPRDRESAPTGP